MISAVITERGSDEDCEAGAKAARIAIESFLKRPSMADRAVMAISRLINDGLYIMRSPKNLVMCDGAVLFMLKDTARWFISGTSRIYHFVDGKLAHRSAEEPAPVLGARPDYKARLEAPVLLQDGRNAFLLCSGNLWEKVAVKDMERALAESADPDGWMRALVDLAGAETQFCACAIFLPNKRRIPLPALAALAAILIGIVAWLLVRS